MKKIYYSIILILLSITSLNAAEIKDCSGLKKFSKQFFACKSGNLKSGIERKLSGLNNPLKGVIEYQKKAWSKKN
jgi:hypothetical protein